jgi:hypothetical protein
MTPNQIAYRYRTPSQSLEAKSHDTTNQNRTYDLPLNVTILSIENVQAVT